jgi:hypothetical protein
LEFLKVKSEWMRLFSEQSHYTFIIQIVLLFCTALIIAAGDPEEKDWMERRNKDALL